MKPRDEMTAPTELPTVADLLAELDLDADWLARALAKEERRRAYAASGARVQVLPLMVPLLLNRGDRLLTHGIPFDGGAHDVRPDDSLGDRTASILRLCRYFRRLPERTTEAWAARRRRILSDVFHDFHSCLVELALHDALGRRKFAVRFTDQPGRGGPDLVIGYNGAEWPAEVKSRVRNSGDSGASLEVDDETIRAVTRLFTKPLRSGQIRRGQWGAVFVEVTGVDGILLQQQLADLPFEALQQPFNKTLHALRAAVRQACGPETALVLMLLDPQEYRVAGLSGV